MFAKSILLTSRRRNISLMAMTWSLQRTLLTLHATRGVTPREWNNTSNCGSSPWNGSTHRLHILADSSTDRAHRLQVSNSRKVKCRWKKALGNTRNNNRVTGNRSQKKLVRIPCHIMHRNSTTQLRARVKMQMSNVKLAAKIPHSTMTTDRSSSTPIRTRSLKMYPSFSSWIFVQTSAIPESRERFKIKYTFRKNSNLIIQ